MVVRSPLVGARLVSLRFAASYACLMKNSIEMTVKTVKQTSRPIAQKEFVRMHAIVLKCQIFSHKKETRPSRCAEWIVKGLRDQQADQPTDTTAYKSACVHVKKDFEPAVMSTVSVISSTTTRGVEFILSHSVIH